MDSVYILHMYLDKWFGLVMGSLSAIYILFARKQYLTNVYIFVKILFIAIFCVNLDIKSAMMR